MLRADDSLAIEPAATVGHNRGYEIMLRRLKRAEELGMSYREYTAIILDRGVYL